MLGGVELMTHNGSLSFHKIFLFLVLELDMDQWCYIWVSAYVMHGGCSVYSMIFSLQWEYFFWVSDFSQNSIISHTSTASVTGPNVVIEDLGRS